MKPSVAEQDEFGQANQAVTGTRSVGRATMPAPLDLDEMDEQARRAGQTSTVPPSQTFTPLDVPFELPEQRFFQQLDERARRAELLNALLGAGGIPKESAVLALQAALGAIVGSATDASLPTLANLATALRRAIGNLGITGMQDERRVVDTLVLDESELQRDLVALAVEAQGHTVRCAATYEDFVAQLGQRRPGLVITEVQFANAPAKSFCSTLKEVLESQRVPVVFFSDLPAGELSSLAQTYGARRSISKEFGIDLLIGELREVYRQILDIRETGGRPRFKTPRP